MQNDQREAVGRLQFFADGLSISTIWSDDRFDNQTPFELIRSDLKTVLALLSARPLALGVQRGGQERCQRCGGEVQGWLCQSCPAEFRENDDGHLVFDEDTTPARAEAQDEGAAGEPFAWISQGDVELHKQNGGTRLVDLWTKRPDARFSARALYLDTTPARAKALDEGAAGDLQQALTLALALLGQMEPTDARAVSDEFVAMAAAQAGIQNQEGRDIIAARLKQPFPSIPAEVAFTDAHPSPTPAADADRVRIAVEALPVLGTRRRRPHWDCWTLHYGQPKWPEGWETDELISRSDALAALKSEGKS